MEEERPVHDASVMNRMQDTRLQQDFSRLMVEEIGTIDGAQYAADCVRQIRKRGLLLQMEGIKKEIARLEAENTPDAEKYKESMRMLSEISQELRR